MTDPTQVPSEHENRGAGDPLHDASGAPESGAPESGALGSGPVEPAPDLLPPAETETDLLAARVEGADDHAGMTELWRATMALPHWWFVAVGEGAEQSPAAASIQGKLMLMTFTDAERARHFAVQNGMIDVTEDLQAIALAPVEVMESAPVYESAGIDGLMFDPHISGYFIPTAQLPIVWEAIHSTDRTAGPDEPAAPPAT